MIGKALEQMAGSQLYTQLTWSPTMMDIIIRCLEDWYKTPWAGLVAFRLAVLRVGNEAEIEGLLRRIQNVLTSVTERKQKQAVALVYVALYNPVRRVELMMDLTQNVNTPDGTLLMQTLAGCSCKHRCTYAQALGIPAMAKKTMQTLLMPVDGNWNALRLSTRHAFTPTVDTDRCDALLCFASHVPILSPGAGHFFEKKCHDPVAFYRCGGIGHHQPQPCVCTNSRRR